MITLQTWILNNLVYGTSDLGGSGQETGVYNTRTHSDNSSEIPQIVHE